LVKATWLPSEVANHSLADKGLHLAPVPNADGLSGGCRHQPNHFFVGLRNKGDSCQALLLALNNDHFLSAAWDVGYKSTTKRLLASKLTSRQHPDIGKKREHSERIPSSPTPHQHRKFRHLIDEWHFPDRRFSLAATTNGV
jgi:hypothetical protein